MAINPIDIVATRYGTVGLQYQHIPEVAPIQFAPGKHHIVPCKDVRGYIGLVEVQNSTDKWTLKVVKAALLAALPAIATKVVLVGLSSGAGPLVGASDTCIAVTQLVPVAQLAPSLTCSALALVLNYQAHKLSNERDDFLARGKVAGAPWTRLLSGTRELADFTQLEPKEELAPPSNEIGPDALGGAGPGPATVEVAAVEPGELGPLVTQQPAITLQTNEEEAATVPAVSDLEPAFTLESIKTRLLAARWF